MNKKFLSFLLILTMTFTLFVPAVLAQDNSENLNISDDYKRIFEEKIRQDKGFSSQSHTQPFVFVGSHPSSVIKGEIFNFYIGVDSIQDLYGYSIDLKFDPSLVELVDINKPVYDDWTIFTENGVDLNNTGYINRVNPDDPSIIEYAVTKIGDEAGVNAEFGLLGEISFRVKDDIEIPNNIYFNVTDLLTNNFDVVIKLSDSNAQPITFDGYGTKLEIHDPSEIKGYIKLQWADGEFNRLSPRFEVVDNYGNNRTIYINAGYLHEFPNAFSYLDKGNNTYYIAYNTLYPGSTYYVKNHDKNVQINSKNLKVSIVDVNGNELGNYDISNATGTGNIWNVFEVNGSGLPIAINELVEENGGPIINDYFINIRDMQLNDETGILALEGEVVNSTDEYNYVDIYLNDEKVNVDPVLLNEYNEFSYSLQLNEGINIVVIKYADFSMENYYFYNTIYIDSTINYDDINQKYDTNITLEIDSNELGTTSSAIYGKLFKVNRYNSTIEFIDDLTFNYDLINNVHILNYDATNLSHGEYYLELYYDIEKTDLIKTAHFWIDPINITSENVRTTNEQIIKVTGFLAFTDDYESFKVYIDDEFYKDITVDQNGNFEVEITLNEGNNNITLELVTPETSYLRIWETIYDPNGGSIDIPEIMNGIEINYVNEELFITKVNREELPAEMRDFTRIAVVGSDSQWSQEMIKYKIDWIKANGADVYNDETGYHSIKAADNYIVFLVDDNNDVLGYYLVVFDEVSIIDAPIIVPLENQTHSEWHDGKITVQELEQLINNQDIFRIDINLPDGIGTGGFIEGIGPVGYQVSVSFYNQLNERVYGSISWLDQDEVDSKFIDKSLNIDDLKSKLTLGETYTIIASIVQFDNDGNFVKEGKGSIPVQFSYIDDNTQLSSDATLASLEVSNGTLSPSFNPNTLEYTVTLPDGTTDVPTVTAIQNDENATVEINNASALTETTTITVTAEDGNIQTYTINFEIEENNVKTDTKMSFKLYKAERTVNQFGTFYAKKEEINDTNTVSPGEYIYVDVYGENIIKSLGIDLEIKFNESLLELVNNEFKQTEPFRIGTEPNYIIGLAKQPGKNELKEGTTNVIKYVSGTDTELSDDNKPIGYLIFKVRDDVEGNATFEYLLSKVAWNENGEAISYNVENGNSSLKIVKSIDVSVSVDILRDSIPEGSKIEVYNIEDDITNSTPIKVFDVIEGKISVTDLDLNKEYKFLIKIPQHLSKLLENGSLQDNSLEFGKVLAGDLNNDDFIELADFVTLIKNYDKEVEIGDLNGDGTVELSDFVTLIKNYDEKGATKN